MNQEASTVAYVPSHRRRRARLAEAMAWFLAALLLRAGVRWWSGFDGYWGQDAWGYLDQATRLHRWTEGGPVPLARWPQGYPALMIAVERLGLSRMQAGQWVSLTAGAATVPTVWLAARAWWPEHARVGARVAAALVLLSPVHVLWSTCATSDATSVLWLATAAWSLGRSGRARHPAAWMVLSGAALALALSTRLASGLALPAFVWAAAWRLRRGRQTARGVQVAALAFALVLAPQAALWLGQPETVAHPWLLGWRPWHAWQRTFVTADGAASYVWPQALFAAFPALHPGYLGTAAAALAGAAALALVRTPRPATGFLLAWVAGAWLFFAGMPYQNYRFGLVALVPWAVLAGNGAAVWSRRRRAGVVGLLLLTFALQGVWAARLIPRHVNMARERTDAAQHIHRLLPGDAQLLAFGLTADLAGRSGREVVELASETEASLATRWPSKRLTFAVFDEAQLRRQWQGKPPALRVDWLRARARFELVERVGRWAVWRLAPPRLPLPVPALAPGAP